MLAARGLCAGHDGEDVLHDVSIAVRRATIVPMIGSNGSGKSTLLKTVYGLVRARRREAVFFGGGGVTHDPTGLRPNQISALGTNLVPQLANVFPEMSVLENLEIGSRLKEGRFTEHLDR